jgi:hypothetical protein
MIPDPNDEILAIKRRLAARFENDLHRIAEDIRSRQHENGREVVSLPPRRCESKLTPLPALLNRSGEAIVAEAIPPTLPLGEK